MNCADVAEQLPAYQEGALAPEAEARVARHLVACSQCREEDRLLRGTWDLLGDWAELEPSDGLTDAIMASVAAERGKVVPLRARRGWALRTPWVARAAAAAAVVLLAFGLVLTGPDRAGKDSPVVDEMVATWDAGTEVAVLDGMPQYVASSGDRVTVPSILFEPSDPRHRGTEDEMLEEIIADQNG